MTILTCHDIIITGIGRNGITTSRFRNGDVRKTPRPEGRRAWRLTPEGTVLVVLKLLLSELLGVIESFIACGASDVFSVLLVVFSDETP
jgi:hypothetical protein